MSASVASAGLVSSKTSQGLVSPSLVVAFAPSIVAERRIAGLKRSVWASGHLHKLAENGVRPPVAWFVTLTYAKRDGWEPDHVSRAVEAYRQWCRRKGVLCRYTWVAELQNVGQPEKGIKPRMAVHYHLLAWLPKGVAMPKWDRPLRDGRAGFWRHGMTERAVARSGVGYLMKYLSKLGEFCRFPKGLRLYGIGGLNVTGRAVRSWFNLPEWAKRLHGVGELVRAKAGLVVLATGECLVSPWKVTHVPGGLLLRLVGVMPERWADGAYSGLRT